MRDVGTTFWIFQLARLNVIIFPSMEFEYFKIDLEYLTSLKELDDDHVK